ncbi:S41 family peptidase, partial [Acinetobacter baumannii]|nr:S41 family peptidase [Acinetobacter baumannii]
SLFPSKNFPYKTLELNSFREYDAHWLIKKFQYEKERKNLIIDLTRNRGGRVQLVHEVARYFLKKPILTLYKDTLKP